MANNRVSSILTIFSFSLLLSISHARFHQLPINNDDAAAIPEVQTIHASNSDPKILLPTDKDSDSSSEAVIVNLEVEEKETALPATSQKEAIEEEPLDVAGDQRKPPYDEVMNHRPWMMTMMRWFFPPRHPDFDPNCDHPQGPHHRRHHHHRHGFPTEEENRRRPLTRFKEEDQWDEIIMPLRKNSFFHHRTTTEAQGSEGKMTGTKKSEDFHQQQHEGDDDHHIHHQPDDDLQQQRHQEEEAYMFDFHPYHDRNGYEFENEREDDDQACNDVKKLLP